MSEILFIPHRFPYPPDRGDRIRSWNILKALTKIAPVHIATLFDDLYELRAHREVQDICASMTVEHRKMSKRDAMIAGLKTGLPASVAAFSNGHLQDHINWLLTEHPISTIFAFSGQMAQFVPEPRRGVRFVMDFVDVDSAKFHSYADQSFGVGALANRFEGRRLAAFEKRVAERADVSLFVSDAEAALFRQQTGLGAKRVRALENGIDLDRFDPALGFDPVDPQGVPLIVFTGQMDYRPNIDAVRAFAQETLPLIRQSIPSAQFAIVGRAPTDEVKALVRHPGVIVTGEVDDPRVWLAAADVVVAPLKLARGIQNKVLEAMAMAKAVVASSAAAEGIDAERGREILVADDAKSEASTIVSLIENEQSAIQLGLAARRRMVARYSWESRLAGLADIVAVDPLLMAAE
jgi:polysaccharide biosynthesis protein PslH